jgi:hypothetical protein
MWRAGKQYGFCALIVLASWTWQGPWALGGTSTSISLPPATKGPVNGLRLTLNCDWVESPGYHPVRIDVIRVSAATADRTLYVELSTVEWMNDRKIITAAAEVEIPAGSASVNKVFSIPRYATHPKLALDVWEDGVHLDDLSADNIGIGAPNPGMGWDASAPAIFFVAPGNIDLSQLTFLKPFQGNYMRNQPGLANTIAGFPNFMLAPANYLVEHWINYSSFDVIFISLVEAENLAANRPGVWHALRQWTWAGGNLCVFGAGDDWHGLASLEQLLDCPATVEEAKAAYRGWNEPLAELYDADQHGLPVAQLEVDADGNPIQTPAVKPRRPAAAPFVRKHAMLGQVVAIADSDPFPGQRFVWNWMFNDIGLPRWQWQYRHGLAPDRDNPDFDNFLIADIGLPPVKTYRVLITLFVVAIGPLNYWFLRRKGRLHLLLFTVPLAAMLASGGLIGYAVLADGFQSRIRARSFTALDQRNHEAVCWSRLSYYTGLAPSDGLMFPDDTMVVPLERNETANSFGGGRSRRLAWVPQQHLSRGWLSSRTPTQYVTVRANENNRELKITPAAGKKLCTIENQLGVNIQNLFLRDAGGQFYYMRRIDAGKTVQPSFEAPDGAGLEMNTALLRDKPNLPSLVPSGSKGGLLPFRPVRFTFPTNPSAQTGTSGSLLERELDHVASVILSKSLEPRSYIAIVDHPAEVVYGLEGLVESESLHVIFGTW